MARIAAAAFLCAALSACAPEYQNKAEKVERDTREREQDRRLSAVETRLDELEEQADQQRE